MPMKRPIYLLLLQHINYGCFPSPLLADGKMKPSIEKEEKKSNRIMIQFDVLP